MEFNLHLWTCMHDNNFFIPNNKHKLVLFHLANFTLSSFHPSTRILQKSYHKRSTLSLFRLWPNSSTSNILIISYIRSNTLTNPNYRTKFSKFSPNSQNHTFSFINSTKSKTISSFMYSDKFTKLHQNHSIHTRASNLSNNM